jgi:pimeloyl-ACP methyl ester carboxylesterase
VNQGEAGQTTERLSAAARHLRLPVHLIRGGSSNLVSESAAQQFLQLAPHAVYTDVAGAGHMVAGDRNDAFTEAVVTFIQGPKRRR